MSEPKFTPGPLCLYAVGDGASFYCPATEDGHSLLTVIYEDDVPFAAVYSQADAYLFAAAPDLYAALAAIVADVDTEISDDEYGYARNAPVIVAARASLAKARGEA